MLLGVSVLAFLESQPNIIQTQIGIEEMMRWIVDKCKGAFSPSL